MPILPGMRSVYVPHQPSPAMGIYPTRVPNAAAAYSGDRPHAQQFVMARSWDICIGQSDWTGLGVFTGLVYRASECGDRVSAKSKHTCVLIQSTSGSLHLMIMHRL